VRIHVIFPSYGISFVLSKGQRALPKLFQPIKYAEPDPEAKPDLTLILF